MASATTPIVSAEASMPETGSVLVEREKSNMNVTSLDHIDANIFNTSVNLLPNKTWGDVMNVIDPLSVLSC